MIIIVFGLPGTGKTYFSERLHLSLGIRHLYTDKIREQLRRKGEYDDKTKNLIYNELIKEARMILGQGRDLIIDGTFHKKSRRDRIRHLAEEMNHPVFFIEMLAKEESIRKRLSLNREDSEAGFDVYLKLKEEADPFIGEHLTLWSDSDPVDKMITKAKAYINEHRTNK
ncbi:MAG: AAA family ATPase [bacterium]